MNVISVIARPVLQCVNVPIAPLDGDREMPPSVPTQTFAPSCAVPIALSAKAKAWPSACTARPMYVGSTTGLVVLAALNPKFQVPDPPVIVPLNRDKVQLVPSQTRSATR